MKATETRRLIANLNAAYFRQSRMGAAPLSDVGRWRCSSTARKASR